MGQLRSAVVTATMDSRGRVVIPAAVRRQAGLRPGTELEVRWRDGRIELEPASMPVELVRRGHLVVAVPHHAAGWLSYETVERVRQELREERGAGEE
jgi:AbrB family looped-hinge helix DNA binding protein